MPAGRGAVMPTTLVNGAPGMLLHLTGEAKMCELARWEELKRGPRGEGGQGFPDDAIIPLCDRLNALPGVCTLQSCAGHPRTLTRRWRAPGQLWLWLEERPFWRAVLSMPVLCASPLIEEARVLFGRYKDHRPVVDVTFAGDDRGTLPEAAEVIHAHLAWLANGASNR